jgi:hypothetical protein
VHSSPVTRSLPFRADSYAGPALLLFLFSFALCYLVSSLKINIYDEGIILTGALRALNGELPSRDYYANYGPAQFYLLAGAFEVFGRNLLVARIYDSLIAATVPVLAWLLVRRSGSGALAAASAFLALALLLEFRVPLYPLTPVTAILLLLAWLLTGRLAENSPPRRYLPLAAPLGLVLLMRYDLAAIAVLALALPFFAILLVQRAQGTITSARLRKTVLFAVGGVAGVFAAILGLLAMSGILMPVLHDLIVFNGRNYVATRSLPFPGLAELLKSPLSVFAVYLPIPAVLIGTATLAIPALAVARGARPRFPADARHIAIAILVSIALFAFTKGLVRTSPTHMMASTVASVPLVFLCLAGLGDARASRLGRMLRSGVAGVSLGGCALLLAYVVNAELSWERARARLTATRWPNLPALLVFGVDDNRRKAAEYIVAHSPENARILSATGRHDKIFVNDIAIYFIADRLPGTRWHHYDPGVQTSREVQEEMIRDLERNRVDLVLRDRSADGHIEGNKSDESSGVHELDRYLDKVFRPVVSFGSLEIYRRVGH